MIRVGNYTIDQDALNAIPESLARELSVFPIGFRDGKLRVIAGNRPEAELRKAMHTLAFVTKVLITCARADLSEVKLLVDEIFTPASVDNCSVDFEVRCPKEWLRLRPTEQIGVRFCEECKQRVYLCKNDKEAREHTSLGNCIAVERPECIDIGLATFQDPVEDRSRS
jgi:hypothetical protein